jgi:hypothetical protein
MALSSDRLALLRAVLAEKGLAAPHARAIPRRAAAERAPLSFAQERLFFLELYQPGTPLYNDCVAVRVQGVLDPERLARALAAVQARHEILRTTFALAGAGPEQRVHEPGPPPLSRLDLSGASDAAVRARSLAAAEARTPFDLERAPAWRVLLARLAPDAWLLVVTMHHIVSDGATLGLLFDELSAAYATDAGLAPLALQFGDYAAWERSALDERRAAEHLAHWTRVLGGELPACAWPERLGQAGGQGAWVPIGLGSQSLAHLRTLARAEDATSNQVLLAAWLALLALVTGENDQRTGIASSLRTRRELEPLLGFFVQSLVLRADLGGDPTFGELVRRVRTAVLQAHAHAELPFDRVVRALERAPGRGDAPPLAPTFFSHMNNALRAPRFEGARATWEFVDPGVARFEIALVLHESERDVTGFLEYDLGVFAGETAAHLGASYVRLLEAVLARPELRLSELALLCAPVRRAPSRRAPLAFPTHTRRAAGGLA